MFTDEERTTPTVLGASNLAIALGLHVALFLVAYLYAVVVRKPKETVVPIDMTVVVHENLDGNENEPPPMKPPEPQLPQPRPEPRQKPEPPPVVEPKADAVEKVIEKKKPDKPRETSPTKTAEQLRKEKEERQRKRLEEIRNRGKVVNRPTQKSVERQPNGRTGPKTIKDVEKFLNRGYKPGRTEQLAQSEYQRCVSLIRQAFYAKWDRPPWTDTLREMHLSVQLGPGGRILGYRLVRSSGDAKADATVLVAASLVKTIAGLSAEFIQQNRSVLVRFKVTPQEL